MAAPCTGALSSDQKGTKPKGMGLPSSVPYRLVFNMMCVYTSSKNFCISARAGVPDGTFFPSLSVCVCVHAQVCKAVA